MKHLVRAHVKATQNTVLQTTKMAGFKALMQGSYVVWRQADSAV